MPITAKLKQVEVFTTGNFYCPECGSVMAHIKDEIKDKRVKCMIQGCELYDVEFGQPKVWLRIIRE